ncbi:UNVERIFIED_CONTAM: hypothetical protein GTU68_049284 [Idotea baltica]|nr:hypothetical protein [Idotea baltica]
MYIVTGGAGFIGSAIVSRLNQDGINDILIVDNLTDSTKWKNLINLSYTDYIHKDKFIAYLDKIPSKDIQGIIHMGACSSTTEMDVDYLMENNFRYTCQLADFAYQNDIRFIYASSAATYGNGEYGYGDKENFAELKPLNPYGYSKQIFDIWAHNKSYFDKIVGLKFFNVYGPNEYHKDEQRSVVHKAFQQIQETGSLKLFKSYIEEYKDGEQKRDFIYVKDCAAVIVWLLDNQDVSGLFNLGTGNARSWNDLAKAVFNACSKDVNINYIEMPGNLKNQYQYFTEAEMSKFSSLDSSMKFASIEDGVKDYVQSYLLSNNKYL